MYVAPCTFDEMLPPHSPNRPGALAEITESMQQEGWTGRPLLGLWDGRAVYLLTGSHRYAAAKAAGLLNADGEEGLDVAIAEVDSERWEARGEEIYVDGVRVVDYEAVGPLADLLKDDPEALALLQQEGR